MAHLPTVCQGDILAHHVRGHDHGVDAELDEPRDELGEGRDCGSPAKGKLDIDFRHHRICSHSIFFSLHLLDCRLC